ncbi:stalk domain-containing protein [Cohnella faecalis]|nr:stalk domain-containing protein [Cohnella faecalis]
MSSERKWIYWIGTALLAIVVATGGSDLSFAAGKAQPPINVVVDGAKTSLAVNPYLGKEGIMLPYATLFQALKIDARLERKTLVVRRANTVYKIDIGSTKLMVGNRQVRLTTAPVIVNGRVFVPKRYVELVLDKQVTYDAKLNLVTIGLTEKAKLALQKMLFEAARLGDAATIEKVVKQGIDPNGKLKQIYLDNTALVYAVNNNRTAAVRALIKNGAKVIESERYLGTRAISLQNAEILGLLLDAGLDPNYREYGNTLLETASTISSTVLELSEVTQGPSPAVVETLLKHGADPGLDDSLARAIGSQNYSIIQLLLRAGAKTDKPDRFGQLPYNMAASYNIQRWMSIQNDQPKIPTFVMEDDQGVRIHTGAVAFRSLSAPSSGSYYTNWSLDTIYADVPDGSYQVTEHRMYGQTTLFPSSMSFTVKDGVISPSVQRLPTPNVAGKIVGDPSKQAIGGHLELTNEQASFYSIIEVDGDHFKLSIPPGQYKLARYTSSNGTVYPLNKAITIENKDGVQELIVQIGEIL